MSAYYLWVEPSLAMVPNDGSGFPCLIPLCPHSQREHRFNTRREQSVHMSAFHRCNRKEVACQLSKSTILEKIFRERYVNSATLEALMGKSVQGQRSRCMLTIPALGELSGYAYITIFDQGKCILQRELDPNMKVCGCCPIQKNVSRGVARGHPIHQEFQHQTRLPCSLADILSTSIDKASFTERFESFFYAPIEFEWEGVKYLIE